MSSSYEFMTHLQNYNLFQPKKRQKSLKVKRSGQQTAYHESNASDRENITVKGTVAQLCWSKKAKKKRQRADAKNLVFGVLVLDTITYNRGYCYSNKHPGAYIDGQQATYAYTGHCELWLKPLCTKLVGFRLCGARVLQAHFRTCVG